MQEVRSRIVTPEAAISVIRSGWAVIKTISSPLHSNQGDRSWELIIKSFNNPGQGRFVKPIDENVDRWRRFNPQEQCWEQRNITHPRGRDKQTPFTKKSSVTLIPPNGMVKLFKPRYGDPIGLMFDWRLCDRKGDRYVFSHNIVSDKKPWLFRTNQRHQPPIGISLALLQKQLRELQPGLLAKQNELLGGLRREAVTGIVAPKNSLSVRMNALLKKMLLWDSLALDLPVFIIDENLGIIEYTVEMQRADIKNAVCNLHRPIPIAPPLNASHRVSVADNKQTLTKEYALQVSYNSREVDYVHNNLNYQENYLMRVLVSGSQDLINATLAGYPQLVTGAVENIQKLYLFTLKWRGSSRYRLLYEPKQISNAWESLVKAQVPKMIVLRDLDKSMKQSAASTILSEVALATSLDSIDALYQHYVDSPILKARRNPKWDNFCTIFRGKYLDPLYTHSKREVIHALQERALHLLQLMPYPNRLAHALQQSTLFSQVHIDKGVVPDVKNALAQYLTEYTPYQAVAIRC